MLAVMGNGKWEWLYRNVMSMVLFFFFLSLFDSCLFRTNICLLDLILYCVLAWVARVVEVGIIVGRWCVFIYL